MEALRDHPERKKQEEQQKRGEKVAWQKLTRVCVEEQGRGGGESSKPDDQSSQARVAKYPVLGADLDVLKEQQAHGSSDERDEFTFTELLGIVTLDRDSLND